MVFFVALLAPSGMPHAALAQMTPEQRAALEAELGRIEADIALKRRDLEAKQRERTSLERDVAILDGKIETAKLSIRQRDLAIRRLQSDISDKQNAIKVLDTKVAKGEESVAQLLRLTQAIDDTTMVELVLGASFSDMFRELDEFEMVHRSLQSSFDEMALARQDLSARKLALESQRAEEEELRQIQELQRQSLVKAEKEKQALVAAAKGQEKIYQQLIAERQKDAAVIRSALFDLRDSSAIPFGTAYQYAKEASAKTGVRPALILGVLRQETNLGENVGTGNWRTDMHPTRDQPVFETLMAELGLDPDQMPVSRKPSYGWGGAMGPAQFIPSTWVLYKERIANMTGQNPPNPWSARTAIFATALLLMDNGADKGTRAAERLAALRYFAGWGNANKAAYAFYGDDVMEFADEFQRDIDILEAIASR